MSYISYQQYKELIKGFKSRHRKKSNKNLIVGCYYYIDNVPERPRKSETNYRTVMHGKYIEEYKENEDTYYKFSNIRFIVNPFQNSGIPTALDKTGFVFILDENTPCADNILNKQKNLKDLESTIDEMKVQPVEKGESNISFMGEDYRLAMKQLNKTHKYPKSSIFSEIPRSTTSSSSLKSAKSSKSKKNSKSASLGGNRKTQKRKTSKPHK
jgi:hypothetical protein